MGSSKNSVEGAEPDGSALFGEKGRANARIPSAVSRYRSILARYRRSSLAAADSLRARFVRGLGVARLAALAVFARLKRFFSSSRGAAPLLGAIAFAIVFLAAVPPETRQGMYSRALYSSGQRLLGAFVSADGQWHFPPGSEVDGRFERAVLEFEDRRFFCHVGFDPRAIARAFVQNVSGGGIVSGGSTITMQAIRSARHGERTLFEKALELWYAVRLELFHGKDEILARYMADAPFGGNVVGVEAASFRYLGRSPESMSWAEAAMLAVLPNSPSLIHLARGRDQLVAKRDRLLRRLDETGVLPDGELDLAFAEPLPPEPYAIPQIAPHLLQRAALEFPERARIVSTVDFEIQGLVAKTLERHTERLSELGVANAAVVVLRISDGAAVAYAGNLPKTSATDGAAFARDVDCAVARRSSGSTFKPFLYACMLDSGDLLPRQLVADIPTRYGSFSPENNSGEYSGAVRVDEALARSLNVPFIRLLRTYGAGRFKKALESLGMTTIFRDPDDYGLTLVIGGAETTLWELSGAYASMARACMGGDVNESSFAPHYSDGAAVERRPLPFSRAAAWLALGAMMTTTRPAEESSWTEFASSMLIAWKTGTSYGFRDAWSVGINGEYVVGVWIGNATGVGRPALYGTTGAAPVMFQVFRALPRSPWFATPVADLRSERVCAESGYLASPDCPSTAYAMVPSGSIVRGVCPYCARHQLSLDGKYRVDEKSAGTYGSRDVALFSLPPAMEWYFRRKSLSYKPLPPLAPGSEADRGLSFEIVVPQNGLEFYVPLELDGSPGAVVFEAVHRDPEATLYWHLDDAYLGMTKGMHQMSARPSAGAHKLTVIDGEGVSQSRYFTALNER